MSLIREEIKALRDVAQAYSHNGLGMILKQAADTIEELSAKLATANMERSTAYYNDGWIPCSEKTPEFEKYTLIPMWVTMRKKDGTCRFVTRLKWNGYHGRWEWNNGKTVSDTWEIIAWQKVNYPAPYQPKGDNHGESNI